MKFSITSILFLPFAVSAVDTNALLSLAPAYPKILPTFWEQHDAEILVGGIIFLAMAAIALWLMFKPRPQEVLPPEVVARHALARLHGRVEDDKVLSEVSQILRRYVGAKCGFDGGTMTTNEFSATVTAEMKIGSRLANALARFLQVCDRDKFIARNEAPPLNAVSRALELIAQIESATHRQDACAKDK